MALRKTAMPTIGRNSPTAPAGRMYLPNRPPSMSWSRRIGSSAPKAVVVSPSATGTKARMNPAYARRPVTTIASTAVTNQQMIARWPTRSLNSWRSSS